MSTRMFCFLLCVVSADRLLAQATFGSMLGTVTDPAGAVVSGAKVTTRSEDLGVSFATTTNESGNYFQTQLPVGTYTLEIEAAGFQRYVAKGVQVSVGTSTRVDAVLTVGQVTEQST